MKPQPTLETPRLLLRPFTLDDAPAVQNLAGEREIAAVTLNVPHPYEDGMAEQWIGGQQVDWEQRKSVVYAVVLREGDNLIGCISLGINREFQHAELGYWLGVPFWRQGYATEAARAIVGLSRWAYTEFMPVTWLVTPRRDESWRKLACSTKAACASTIASGASFTIA